MLTLATLFLRLMGKSEPLRGRSRPSSPVLILHQGSVQAPSPLSQATRGFSYGSAHPATCLLLHPRASCAKLVANPARRNLDTWRMCFPHSVRSLADLGRQAQVKMQTWLDQGEAAGVRSSGVLRRRVRELL